MNKVCTMFFFIFFFMVPSIIAMSKKAQIPIIKKKENNIAPGINKDFFKKNLRKKRAYRTFQLVKKLPSNNESNLRDVKQHFDFNEIENKQKSQTCLNELMPNKALIESIKKDDLSLIECEITKSDDINFCDIYGDTPLIVAIFVGNSLVVKKLLEAGADVKPGKTNPIQVAQFMQNEEIINLLVDWGAQIHSYVGEPRTLRKAWQCECDSCCKRLQAEVKKYEAERAQYLEEFSKTDKLLDLTPMPGLTKQLLYHQQMMHFVLNLTK